MVAIVSLVPTVMPGHHYATALLAIDGTTDSMRGLYLSAVLNGLFAVPPLVFIMILARRRSVMGRFVVSTVPLVIAWLATLVMAAAALMLVKSRVTRSRSAAAGT
ncbi:MAG: hypothetical protein ACYCVM_06180 [Acidiferrobacter sp.]